jgi:hypothetical protein
MNLNIAMTTGLISVLGLFLAGCESSPLNGQSSRAGAKGPALVAQQQKVCQIVLDGFKEEERFRQQANNEKNPIRADALQAQRHAADDKMFDALYAFLGPSGEFQGWRARVDDLGRPNAEGKIKVGFETRGPCNFPLPLYFGGSTGNSNAIPLASPLGQTLAQLDVSKEVVLSGVFLWAPKGGGYLNGARYSDKHHFMPPEGGGYPTLAQIGVSVRLTSITQAR